MAPTVSFVWGTGVGIADICVAAQDILDNGASAADILEAAWAFHTAPQALETSRLVDGVGPIALMVAALMHKAGTGYGSMERMREAMSQRAEGG